MKLSHIHLAVIAAIGTMFATRATATDTAYGFRMPAGFPGVVNRFHPASIIPGLLNSTVQVPRLTGDPVLVDQATNSYRGFTAADTAITDLDGVIVRSYPTQQTSGGLVATVGIGAPTANQPCDVLEDGFILVKVNGAGQPTKKGAVFIWIAASTGNHVQGGFESVATTGSTIAIRNAVFNGPPDANGVTELRLRALL